jgi:hypothetical protein
VNRGTPPLRGDEPRGGTDKQFTPRSRYTTIGKYMNEQPEYLNPLKKSLDDWASITSTNTERNILVAMLRSYLDTSSTIDAFVGWLLVGVGATGSLVITNLDKLIKYIGIFSYKWALLSIAASMLFGIASKFCALTVQIARSAENKIEVAVREALEAHSVEEKKMNDLGKNHGIKVDATIDLSKVFTTYVEIHPTWTQWYVGKLVRKSAADPLYSYKKSTSSFIRQSIFGALQVICLLAFIIIIATGI